MPPISLKHRTVSALAWNSVEKFGQQAVQSIITLILARLLFPADYGLVGMITIFMVLASALLDGGFGSALIQKKSAGQTDFSTVFYFNLGVGVCLYAVFYLTAPVFAHFYREPRLVWLIRFVALNIVINSFGLIQTTLFVKRMDFKATMKASVISSLLSGALAVAMAASGFGVWSLAVQWTAGNLFQTAILWLQSRWRPDRHFSVSALRSLFGFGSRILGSSLLQILDNVYSVIIGKVYSAAQLGYYSQAKRIQNIPVANIASVLQRVTYPALASIQDEPERLRRNFRRIVRSAAFANFPIMLWLAAIARPLFEVLLTSRWLPAVPFFQLLCLAGLVYPLNTVHLNLIKAKGRSDIFLNLEIVKKAILLAAILLTIRSGILALVIGQVVSNYVTFLITIVSSGRLIGYPLTAQWADLGPALSVAVLAAGSAFLLPRVLPAPDIWLLVLGFVVAAAVFLAASRVLRLEAFSESLEIVWSRFLPGKRIPFAAEKRNV
jgi:O-antigen/teichoic acid export membrane protein